MVTMSDGTTKRMDMGEIVNMANKTALAGREPGDEIPSVYLGRVQWYAEEIGKTRRSYIIVDGTPTGGEITIMMGRRDDLGWRMGSLNWLELSALISRL